MIDSLTARLHACCDEVRYENDCESNQGACARELCRTSPPQASGAIRGPVRNSREGTGYVESHCPRLYRPKKFEVSRSERIAPSGDQRSSIGHEYHSGVYLRV